MIKSPPELKGGYGMLPCELWNCTDMLISVICYEMHGERLSPEMKVMLEDHLSECECCRTRFVDFKHLFEKKPGTIAYLQ